MDTPPEAADARLRRALQETGHRFTEQRAAVYRFLASTTSHPNADEVFQRVRSEVPGISLATVYKSLETLVICGLAAKLTYSDGSARYDARMDPHHHARCVSCGRVMDISGQIQEEDLLDLARPLDGFSVLGYRLELTGFCSACSPHQTMKDPSGPLN
ncbi:MAG: transcriptional repressor [Gemmatimonadota bacterium]|jgi:Fur family peroxide stress response transcriptional regulator